MKKVLIKNIGTLITGDIQNPILKEDSVLIEDGKIVEIGTGLSPAGSELVLLDVKGMMVAPGLLDSHCHPVLGDWTPRQRALNWIEQYLKAGVTGLISAGEVHIPGRPHDAEGCKALAILAYKTTQNYRPAGMKVYGGALILEPDAKEQDFADCSRMGMRHTGEIGLGDVDRPETAAPMVAWAHKYGIKVISHTGNTFLAGSSQMDKDVLTGINPDVLCHLNSGDFTVEEMECLITETDARIEFCRFWNVKATLDLLDLLRKHNCLDRAIIGNDAPSGMGISPHGIWEMICVLSSLGDLNPEIAIALATGNTTRFYDLPTGIIKPGFWADLLVLDAPAGAPLADAYSCIKEGMIPGIGLVMVDGQIMAEGENEVNSPPPKKMVAKTRLSKAD